MKKTVSLILALVMCLGLLTACFGGGNQNLEAARDYLQNLYKNKAEITAADYTVVGTLSVNQETYTVEWSVDVTEGVKIVVGENGKVTVDVNEKSDKEIPYVLTATIKNASGNSIQVSFNHKVPVFKELTHAEFMAKENDEAVVIKGVITGIVETAKENDLYLQDTDGGYFVYNLEKKPSEMGLKIGMTVRVTGIRSTYSGIAQVSDAAVEIVDSELKPMDPVDITEIYEAAEELNDDELVDLQSMLVTIKGATVLGQSSDNDTYWCFTLAGNQSYVRISTSTSMLTKEQDTAFKKAVNDHIGYASDVTGLVSLYNGKVYLVPVDDQAFSNFVVAERTPAEQVAFEKELLQGLTSVNEAGTYELPTKPVLYTGVNISWTVSESDYAKIENGKLIVSLPDEEVKVTLTATLSSGEATDTAVYELVISAAPTLIPEIVNAPAVGTGYKFFLKQNNIGKTLFFAGGMDGYYLATTADPAKAADVYLEAADKAGEYYLYYMDGKIKTYIFVYEYTEGKAGIKVSTHKDDTVACTWIYNADINSVSTNVSIGGETKTQYLGTYGTYETFSTSEISHASNSTSFVARFATLTDTTKISDADKIAAEKAELTLPETLEQNAVIDLPIFGSTFTQVKITWAADDDAFVIEGNKLTVTPEAAGKTVNVTATITSGEVSDTKVFAITVSVLVPTIVDAPEAGVEYFFALKQENLDKMLYITGEMNGFYYGTTEDSAAAVKVVLEAVAGEDGKFYLYAMIKGTKTYLNIVKAMGTDGREHINVQYSATAETKYVFNTEHKTLTTDLEDTTYYLGTYGTYNTFSASKLDKIDSSFPSHFYVMAPGTPDEPDTPDVPETPDAPEAVTAPEAGVEYYFALTQKNLGKTLYINGAMSGFYYATTENADEAIKVVLEAVDGKADTYYLYAMIDGVKTYLNIVKSGTHNNVKYGETAITEYVFNTEYNTLTTVLEENTLYFGTYNNYNTFSASTIDKAATSFVAHLYPASTEEAPDEPDTPDTPAAPSFVTAPEAGVEYYFALTQKNLGKTLYINGAMSGFYYATTENADEAIKVVLEAVDGKADTYYLYAMIDGVKTYLNIVKSGTHNNVKYGETAITEYVFNTEYNTLTTVLEENTLYFGTYNNYNTFSASTIDKAATSFVAHFYTVA